MQFARLGSNSMSISFCKVSWPTQDSKDLEQDLQGVVKKVHLRVILQRHAKLKMLKFSELAAGRTPPRQTQASMTSIESSVLHLIPCAKGVMTFQHLGPWNHQNSNTFVVFLAGVPAPLSFLTTINIVFSKICVTICVCVWSTFSLLSMRNQILVKCKVVLSGKEGFWAGP